MPTLINRSDLRYNSKLLNGYTLGYESNAKGYRVYNKEANKLEITRTITYAGVTNHQFTSINKNTAACSDTSDDKIQDVGLTDFHPSLPHDNRMEVNEEVQSRALVKKIQRIDKLHHCLDKTIWKLMILVTINLLIQRVGISQLSRRGSNIIATRGRYDPEREPFMFGTSHMLPGQRNIALPQSTHSGQLVPYKRTFQEQPENYDRKSKRLRITQEQAYVMDEIPETYKEALESHDSQ